MNAVTNKGYLREDFRLFHLRDQKELPVQAHYHEFDKLLLLYRGRVEYTVEGVVYELGPGDVLLIRHHDVHRPVISGQTEYERAIFWISPECLREGETDLEQCFDVASRRRAALYHPSEECWKRLVGLVQMLESLGEDEFSPLMRRSCFLLLMGEVNRIVRSGHAARPEEVDRSIDVVLRHINSHLAEELTVESLAAMCYLSRYHFMRRFKDATGYTVHQYIQLKRLTLAAGLLAEGKSAGETAAECGFGDYSTFLRAFRRHYGVAPGSFARGEGPELASGYRE